MTTFVRGHTRTGRIAAMRPSPLSLLIATFVLFAFIFAAFDARAASDLNRAGLLFKSPQDDRLIVPSALSTEVEIHANGLVQRVRVLQKFRNDTAAWLEGVYV